MEQKSYSNKKGWVEEGQIIKRKYEQVSPHPDDPMCRQINTHSAFSNMQAALPRNIRTK